MFTEGYNRLRGLVKNNYKKLLKVIGVILFVSILSLIIDGGRITNINNHITVTSENIRLSYDYLTSVTVCIQGQSSGQEDTLDEIMTKGYYCTEMGWLGTGVIIAVKNGYTYILTNAHVAGRGMKDPVLTVEDRYREKPAELVNMHGTLDMAVIRVKGILHDKQAIKELNVGKVQDNVYLCGHNLGRKYLYGEGVIAGYQDANLVVQIPTLFGNSGSGVFNTKGELVGLIFSCSGTVLMGIFPVIDVAHGIAIDGEFIQLYLERVEELK